MKRYPHVYTRTFSGAAFLLAWFMLLILPVSGISAQESGARDLAIEDAVRDELIKDFSTPAQKINVSVTNGFVTLEGTVDNILAKQRALNLAETVKGVRGVFDKMDVVPPTRAGLSNLEDTVEDMLLSDPATESAEIRVESDQNGGITLSGVVDSYQERELAGTIAKSARGVRSVNNKIQVDYKVNRKDSEIRMDIYQTLNWDVLVDNSMIDLDVQNGKVTLSGTVGSAAEKRQAIRDAWVAGVKSVDASDLKVAVWARDDRFRLGKYEAKTDQEIREALQLAFLYNPRVNLFNINSSVQNGVVTLSGEVDNLKAKREAMKEARSVVGVKEIRNRIQVRPASDFSDTEIANKIRHALLRNVYVDRYDMDVNVTNGVATLTGTVDSVFEKGQADDVASRIKGVRSVQNNLTVSNDSVLYTYDPYVDEWNAFDYGWYRYTPVYSYANDSEIRDDVEDEIFWSPFVDSEDVNIRVYDGTVTLTGRVDSWAERNAAIENAYEGGAVRVIDRLELKSS